MPLPSHSPEERTMGDELVKALKAAKGYMLNAKIDIQTNTRKQTTLDTLEGGLRVVEAALAAWTGRVPAAVVGDGFTPDEFRHVANEMRRHADNHSDLRAVMSNNFNVILAALNRAAVQP